MLNKSSHKTTKSIFFSVIMGFISSNVFALENIDRTLTVDVDSLIEIEHMDGDAKILGWDKDQVRVVGKLGERTDEFRFERKGKTVVIEVEVKKMDKGWSWNSSELQDDLTIYVPYTSRVNYRSINADLIIKQIYGSTDVDMINGELEATELKGSVRLKTVNGEIYAKQMEGEIVLDSVNGEIEVEQLSGGEIYINTVNGDIEGASNAQEVKATTVNGEIELKLSSVKDLNTSTVNGEIEIILNLADGGTVKASSVSGSVELAFQKDVEARFSIEAHAGGKIYNELTSDTPKKAKYGPRRWLEFSTVSPNAWVDISTVSGKIKISSEENR